MSSYYSVTSPYEKGGIEIKPSKSAQITRLSCVNPLVCVDVIQLFMEAQYAVGRDRYIAYAVRVIVACVALLPGHHCRKKNDHLGHEPVQSSLTIVIPQGAAWYQSVSQYIPVYYVES